MSSKTKCAERCIFPDLLFGVGSATSAGPTLPNGSIHPSPETLEKDCGGYTRGEPIIGFGQAYVSGSGGTKCYGNFLLAPSVDKIELDHAKRASFATKGSDSEYLRLRRSLILKAIVESKNKASFLKIQKILETNNLYESIETIKDDIIGFVNLGLNMEIESESVKLKDTIADFSIPVYKDLTLKSELSREKDEVKLPTISPETQVLAPLP